jgi:hypothetical protein
MVHHLGTTLPQPHKDLDSSVMGDSDTAEDGEISLPSHKLPESLCFASHCLKVEALMWG